MVALSSTLPIRLLPVLDPDGTFSLPWYRKLQELSQNANGSLTPAEVAAILAAIALLETEVTALQAMLASQKIVRFYGAFTGKPDPGQAMFEAGIEMKGDEVFPAGLSANLGGCTVAPALAAVFNVTINGTVMGYMQLAAGAMVATWSMTSVYTAAPGDVLNFIAPAVQDATLSGPRYTFVGTRS